jgi:hypothetical protein
MSEQPTDPKLITADLIAELLRELPRLEKEYEQAKHDCVSGEFPVSDEVVTAWADEQHIHELSQEQAEAIPGYREYDKAATEFQSTNNYLLHIVPYVCQQLAMEQVADRFSSLRGIRGVFEMDQPSLTAWMEHEACPQGIHVGRFVLSLWRNEPTSFNVADAFAVWDEEHRNAYVQWLKQPVVHQELLWGQILAHRDINSAMRHPRRRQT